MGKKLRKQKVAVCMTTALVLGIIGGTVPAAAAEESSPAGEMGGYTINFMTGQAGYKEEAYTAIADKMKEEYDITVEYEVIPDSQFTNLAQVRLSTGETPDIIQVNLPDAYNTYDAETMLLPLDGEPWIERMTVSEDLLTADDGQIYGMPITGLSGVMGAIYNKDVFEKLGLEVPKTYEEFLNVLDTVKNSGEDITPLYLSFKDTWTSQIGPMIYFANALDDRCSEVYEQLDTNQIQFADIPEYKQALTDFQALIQEEYVNADYSVGTYDTAKEYVATGKAAMILSGEYTVNDIVNDWPDSNIGMFPVPYNDVDKIMTANYVYGLIVPKDTPNADNAKDFLNKLSQPEFLSLYLDANGVNSPFTDVDSKINDILKEMYDTYLNTGEYVIQVGDVLSKFGSLNDDIVFPAYAQLAMGEDVDNVIEQIDNGMQEYGANLGHEGF